MGTESCLYVYYVLNLTYKTDIPFIKNECTILNNTFFQTSALFIYLKGFTVQDC